MGKMKELDIELKNEERCFRIVITSNSKILTNYINTSKIPTQDEMKSQFDTKNIKGFRFIKIIEVNPITHKKL